jgi:hypothetical protein
MKTSVFWDWYDFGIVLKINVLNGRGDYGFAVDIQFAWLNLWIMFYKKKENTR